MRASAEAAKLRAMRWVLRVSLVLVAGSSGCVGGPVSDWPTKGSNTGGKDDGDDTVSNPQTPPSSGAGSIDAGLSAPVSGDGESARPDGGVDGGQPCDADAGACHARCVDTEPTDPAAPALLGCDEAADSTD